MREASHSLLGPKAGPKATLQQLCIVTGMTLISCRWAEPVTSCFFLQNRVATLDVLSLRLPFLLDLNLPCSFLSAAMEATRLHAVVFMLVTLLVVWNVNGESKSCYVPKTASSRVRQARASPYMEEKGETEMSEFSVICRRTLSCRIRFLTHCVKSFSWRLLRDWRHVKQVVEMAVRRGVGRSDVG